MPWSEGANSDDTRLSSMDHFKGQRVIVTEKMDGENTTMYGDHIHARSIDSKHHESQAWIKNFWSTIKNDIPSGWRICGENLYAKHSIHYTELPSYFLGFSIWNEQNIALDWLSTLAWFSELGIYFVPVLYWNFFDEGLIKNLWTSPLNDNMEGYVIRDAGEIAYDDFHNKVCKFVRKNHVTTDEHWKTKPIIPNKLRKK